MPGLLGGWFFTDRWWRSRWAAEQARRARLAEFSLTIDQLDSMTWQEFEFAVRDLTRRDGIAAEHVGKTGDFSGDVVGYDVMLDETWIAQAKHYGPNTRVGSEDVQKVNGSAWPIYRARLTVVVTTNTFTKQARTFSAKAGVHLIDRKDLIRWASRGAHRHDVLGIA